ncbi:hypothetical protein CAPTEDRAFT_112440, partial [Capitella teleta]
NCAARHTGAFWYAACHHANPNGLYLGGPFTGNANGISWKAFKGSAYSLKFIQMKLRKE